MSYALENQSLATTSNHERTILWAIIGSLLLHAALAIFLPQFKFEASKKDKPQELKIELVQPAPKPAPEPTPAPPEEIKPQPTPEPVKQKVKPLPQKLPDVLPPPTAEPTPPTNTPPPPDVIAVAPKAAEAKPALVVPTPVPPPPPPPQAGPTEEDIDAALAAYKQKINRALAKNLRYPLSAQRHGIGGVAKVEVHIDDDGNVLSAEIVESSGNESLDAEAIELVKRCNIKQFMTKILSGHVDKLTFPVNFTIKSSD